MHWPRNRLKKVPLPFSRMRMGGVENKLDAIVFSAFIRLFGPNENWPISTRQRKEWGQFLSDRGIVWEVRLRNKPNWEGWEFVEGKGGVVVRPQGLEDHVKINHYFVPKDLAMRMLALGELL